MASSIELVDRADQESVHKRFEHIPGDRGDLFLKVEDDDASSIATTDEYIGLELDVQIQRRSRKRRRLAVSIVLFAIAIVLAAVFYAQRSPQTTNNNPTNTAQPDNPTVNQPTVDQDDGDNTPTSGNDEVDEEDTVNLWPTAAPLPSFERCSPPVHSKKGLDVFHLYNLPIVPEAPTQDDYEDMWEYSFSAMDINEKASLIAVGMSDFSADTDYEVGMVRSFGYDCNKNKWKQVGQDLVGTNLYDQFGHSVSSSKDGTVMAVGAPQEQFEGGNGFVQVYFLNDTRWDELGSRIEDLKSTAGYSLLGHAVDLSDEGETLAVLAVVDTNSFVVRVFEYNYNKEEWVRKGHDLKIKVEYADGYDFEPQLTLSKDGDKLTMADPSIGAIVYEFDFTRDKWKKSTTKQPTWEEDDYWIESVDLDGGGDIIAFSAFEVGGKDDTNITNMAKVVSFDKNATEVYAQSFEDFSVDISVAVSDNGKVAAILGSRDDWDDDTTWYGDEQYVGAMTIITDTGNGKWRAVGKGTKSENIGVPGDFVSLAGDGKLAVVGSDKVVSFYGIVLDGDSSGTETDTSESGSTNETPTKNFTICAPFPDAKVNDHVGDLDKLPKQPKEHTLSMSLSENGSIAAVGIDSYEGENRGLVRVFAWSCANQTYVQLGQDLFGSDDFDGFGQSVDLSRDGMTLVVGANQPPPGKTGYVEVYSFADGEWKIVGHRLDNVKDIVEDLGREVKISDDGSIVMFSGSIIEKDAGGWHETSSFLRVMENVDSEWVAKGDDLISSIAYDEYGAEVHISQSGDGQTLAVTGSYSTFMAKIYTFDDDKKNWTEMLIPPLKGTVEDDSEYDWDYEYENFFSGEDISLNDDGSFVAIAGTKYTEDDEFAVVRVLKKDATTGNYTLSHDPVDYENDYTASAVDISGDGQKLAVGINGHSDNDSDQGALYVTLADNSDSGWNSLGNVDGRGDKDLLGSRVSISRDGTLAAATSRRGYVTFFKIGSQ